MKNLNRSGWRQPLVALLVWAGLTLVVVAKDSVLKTEANVMVEVTLTAKQSYADPFNDVTLDVVFIEPKGRELRVPAFWAGTNIWKARYASPIVGQHSFRSECSSPTDLGLHGITGQVEVKPYTGKNPLYAHGPLKASANRRYLEHTDGTPFLWLGDTWWMGLCHRLHWPDEFKTLAADRKEKGFNVIQFVAGLYPDMHPFDPRGANEAGYPWETNYARIRPQYFNAADQRIEYLVEQGFTPCIVGAWGYFIPWMGVEKAKAHWRNLVARYGALPVVWCVAGEANLPWYLAKGFPYDDRKQVKDWTEVTRYLRQMDPFHRLITIHPTGIGRLSARNAIEDLSLIDIDMLQTPHGQREAVPPTVRTMRESYADKPVMPVINGEASYEMLNEKIPAEWPRAMFWVCLLNGAAGHTYGANGIWQCNRPGQPHGPSPTAGSPSTGYGATPWNEAMNFPGSRQIGFGKKLIAQYPWQHFTPHPEWATFVREADFDLESAQWIWFPEGSPAQDAPTEKRFFRKTFTLPPGKSITRARLFAAADDWFTARLNGEILGSAGDWRNGKRFDNLARLLKPGANLLTITAENKPANVPKNPAGLLAQLEIESSNGEKVKHVTDASWRCQKSQAPGWDATGFDDFSWSSASVLGRFGEGPWGRIAGQRDSDGPHAAGIADQVRLIWMPRRESVLVRHLGPRTLWTAAHFDPVSGQRQTLGEARADEAGDWHCEAPATAGTDWVLILEARR